MAFGKFIDVIVFLEVLYGFLAFRLTDKDDFLSFKILADGTVVVLLHIDLLGVCPQVFAVSIQRALVFEFPSRSAHVAPTYPFLS